MLWSWLSRLRSATRQQQFLSRQALRRRGRRLGMVGSGFKPAVVALEDRTVPSGTGGLGGWFGGFSPPTIPLPTGGPATHLEVIARENVTTGQTFDVLVIAETASNLPATGFTDAISLSSTDTTANGSASPTTPLAPLPLSYTFTASDHGLHVFQVNLTTLASESITATDTTSTSVAAGSASVTVNPVPTLAQLLVVAPKSAAVGVPTRVTIVAEDSSGHLLPGFTGTVTLSTSDSAANGLPSTYTFLPSDYGFHSFKVTFETADSSSSSPTTVTATNGSITDTASILVEPATAVTHFAIFALPPAAEGVATPAVVVALNASNQIVTGYTGTVTLSSSDTTATAAATSGGTQTALSSFTYTFTASDAGVHTFYVTFGTTGKQTLTVTDSAASVSNTTDVYVFAFTKTGLPWWFF